MGRLSKDGECCAVAGGQGVQAGDAGRVQAGRPAVCGEAGEAHIRGGNPHLEVVDVRGLLVRLADGGDWGDVRLVGGVPAHTRAASALQAGLEREA